MIYHFHLLGAIPPGTLHVPTLIRTIILHACCTAVILGSSFNIIILEIVFICCFPCFLNPWALFLVYSFVAIYPSTVPQERCKGDKFYEILNVWKCLFCPLIWLRIWVCSEFSIGNHFPSQKKTKIKTNKQKKQQILKVSSTFSTSVALDNVMSF